MIEIKIDPHAGFRPGVTRAIKLAEESLENNTEIAVLGALIHNPVENDRLGKRGVKTIDHHLLNEYNQQKVLIRAHGEPPETYQLAARHNIELIDGTCKIVRRSQQLAEEVDRLGYQVVIIGKKKHAEVISIAGQCKKPAVVISGPEDLPDIPEGQKLFVLAQTTVANSYFLELLDGIKKRNKNVRYRNTICRYISQREQQIREFAANNELIILVGGKNSSNTRVLFETSRSVNQSTCWVEHPDELDLSSFKSFTRIGVTGSASTPQWLMQLTADHIKKFFT